MAKYKKKLDADIRCPLEYGLTIFGGKWKSRIICVLSTQKTLRYSEIRTEMYNITDAVLAATLKELIADGIVNRRSFDEIPPRVEYPQKLYKALMNSQTVLTVWDDVRLVGLIRVLDDSEMLAQIHYVLVHPEYQGQGVAGRMVEYIKEKYKNFMYLELMPEDKNNVPFYEKHGFHVMENGAAMQICNIN